MNLSFGEERDYLGDEQGHKMGKTILRGKIPLVGKSFCWLPI